MLQQNHLTHIAGKLPELQKKRVITKQLINNSKVLILYPAVY